jgi:hypothetical protein
VFVHYGQAGLWVRVLLWIRSNCGSPRGGGGSRAFSLRIKIRSFDQLTSRNRQVMGENIHYQTANSSLIANYAQVGAYDLAILIRF